MESPRLNVKKRGRHKDRVLRVCGGERSVQVVTEAEVISQCVGRGAEEWGVLRVSEGVPGR